MAEAHQGVAFAFIVTEEEGLHLSVSFETFKAVLYSGFRSWRRRFLFFFVRLLNSNQTMAIQLIKVFFIKESNIKWSLSKSPNERNNYSELCNWFKKIQKC